jgi:hypothetical protein
MIWTGVAVAAIVAIATMVQSVSGFGFALLAVPLLSLVIDPKLAVVLLAAVGPLGTVSIAYAERRHIFGRVVLALSVPALAGMPFGLWILARVEPRALEVAIGVLVITLTGLLLLRLRGSDRPAVDIAAGFTSGALVTSTGTSGPPLVFALQSKDLSPSEFRATLSATFLVQGVVTLLAFWIVGRLDAEVGELVLFAAPGLVCGRILGAWLAKRTDPARFRLIVVGLLIGTGMSLLVDAALG